MEKETGMMSFDLKSEVASPAEYAQVSEFYQRCGYARGSKPTDTVLVVKASSKVIGAVLLVVENGVLRRSSPL